MLFETALRSSFHTLHHLAQVVTHWGHTLCDLDSLLKRAGKKGPTTSYPSFLAHFEAEERANPRASVPAPQQMPPVCDAVPDGLAVPTLASLGFTPPSTSVILPGGETEALRRMQAHMQRETWIASFEKPNTSPTELDPAGERTRSTTALSPYLKFGCLSSRQMYEQIAQIYTRHPKHSKPPTSLHGQLLWREFYYTCAHGTPNYERMAGNPICRQIPWSKDDELLLAWREGRTGYPWIDAAMTQLRQEGWIHHLARHAVACFLTRGDLWQSWEKGAAVFDELLLDADPAINYGNWMWLSCSCFFYQYFRCYSPVAFPKKYDKEGDYVRYWLPALRKFPAKYIYEPWKAPIADQKAAGCIIGTDYPKPIVIHETVSKANMEKMAKAYAAHKEAAAGASGSGTGGGGDPEGGGGGAAKGSNGKRPMKQQTLPVPKKR